MRFTPAGVQSCRAVPVVRKGIPERVAGCQLFRRRDPLRLAPGSLFVRRCRPRDWRTDGQAPWPHCCYRGSWRCASLHRCRLLGRNAGHLTREHMRMQLIRTLLLTLEVVVFRISAHLGMKTFTVSRTTLGKGRQAVLTSIAATTRLVCAPYRPATKPSARGCLLDGVKKRADSNGSSTREWGRAQLRSARRMQGCSP